MSISDRIKGLSRRCKYLAAGASLLCLVLVFIAPVPPQAPAVWVPVSRQQLAHEIGLIGKIEPIETAVITAPFEGHALANELSPGMRVEQGQALLTLDTAMLDIKIREALAARLKMQQSVEAYRIWATGPEASQARQMLRVAELSMQSLELELSQVEALFQKGIVPRNERDALQRQRALQTLELEAARAQLKSVLAAGTGEAKTIAEMEYRNASLIHEQMNALLAEKTLHAPFSGVVLSLGAPQPSMGVVDALPPGVLLAMGQQLIKLANMQGLKVVTLVSEADVNAFTLNQQVLISGDGFAGRQLTGHVSAISQMAVPDENAGSAGVFPVSITVNAPAEGDFKDIRLGMSAWLTIVTYRNDNSFIIPHAAVEEVGDTLFVEHRDGLDAPVVRRAVTIGKSIPDGVEVFGVDSGFVRLK